MPATIQPSKPAPAAAASAHAAGESFVPSDAATPMSSAAREQLFERLRKTPVALVVSRGTDGRNRVRPLTTQEAREDGALFFFVPIDGGIAEEVAAAPEILLLYAEPSDNAYVALAGRATVRRDVEKARELWSTIAGAWFTEGPEDPRLGILRVDLEVGEAWEPLQGKVFEFLEIAAASLLRRPPSSDRDHHRFRF